MVIRIVDGNYGLSDDLDFLKENYYNVLVVPINGKLLTYRNNPI